MAGWYLGPPSSRGWLGLIGPAAGVDEHADHDGYLAPIDQVVHHVLRPHVPFLVLERLAVLVDHEGARNGRVVLRRHIDPVRVLGAGIDPAGERVGPANLPLGNAVLRQGVGAQPILGVGVRARRGGRWPRLREGHNSHAHQSETDDLGDRFSHRTKPVFIGLAMALPVACVCCARPKSGALLSPPCEGGAGGVGTHSQDIVLSFPSFESGAIRSVSLANRPHRNPVIDRARHIVDLLAHSEPGKKRFEAL